MIEDFNSPVISSSNKLRLTTSTLIDSGTDTCCTPSQEPSAEEFTIVRSPNVSPPRISIDDGQILKYIFAPNKYTLEQVQRGIRGYQLRPSFAEVPHDRIDALEIAMQKVSTLFYDVYMKSLTGDIYALHDPDTHDCQFWTSESALVSRLLYVLTANIGRQITLFNYPGCTFKLIVVEFDKFDQFSKTVSLVLQAKGGHMFFEKFNLSDRLGWDPGFTVPEDSVYIGLTMYPKIEREDM